jgi:hypothetical protein
MNKRQLSAFTAGLMLLAASCKKSDALYQQAARQEATQNAAVASATPANASAAWRTTGQWNSNPQEGFTVFSTKLSDSSITSTVVAKGLVLVYMNNGKSLVSLPRQQKDGGDAFWYYQLSKNSLQINCDAYAASVNPSSVQVKYFVITPPQLEQLAKAGHDKKSLLTLTYDNAAALLK